jgi:predicted dehydrogenase
MARELRIGLIGYGQMGRIHAYAYRSIPIFYDPLPFSLRLQAVADVVPGAADKAVQQAGFARARTDWRAVVEDPEVDLIDICTPNADHLPVLEAAIAAGKDIYCEKPLCTNLDDARRILDAAERAGIRHQIVAEYRFLPALMQARQLVEAGFVGDVFHFRGLYLHSGYIDPQRPISWRLRREATGGGVLMDLGPHVLDMMRFLVGDAREVSGSLATFFDRRPLAERPGEMGEVDVEDAAQAQFRFAGKGIGSLEVSRCATGSEDELRLEVHGSRGALAFNLMDPNWLYTYDATAPADARGFRRLATVQRYPAPAVAPAPKFAIGWTRAHIASQYALLAAIAADRMPTPNFADAVAVHAHIDAIYRAAAAGGWVSVPGVGAHVHRGS